jgi:hypothetical protein
MQKGVIKALGFIHETVTKSSDPKSGPIHGGQSAHGLAIHSRLRPLVLKDIFFEASQTVRYGRARPRSLERIWVDPRQIRRAVIHPSNLVPDQAGGTGEDAFWLARGWRGRVVSGARFADLEPDLRPLSQNVKLEACRRHWIDGVPWAETGVYDSFFDRIGRGGQKDECETREDVVERYARLDAIFAQVRAERRLRSQMELFPGQEREFGGIEIHIGPGGEPIFGDSGNHRLAMALVLDLPRLPAMLGFVHEDGLDWLARYRSEQEAGVSRRQPPPVLHPARS